MKRRNLIVAFNSNKTNAVVLSELNHRMLMLSDYNNSCLNLTNNQVDFYCSWLPYGGQSVRDTEIGINATVAEAIGLYEGSIVSCKVAEELPILETVHVTATNQKDWEILEASSYRIQNTLLDHTKIVNDGQKLVVWINSAISVVIKIDKLSPNVRYGKIDNSTEFIVTPFKGASVTKKDESPKKPQSNGTQVNKPQSNGLDSTQIKNKPEQNGVQSQSSLYQRLFNKDLNKSNSSQKSNGSNGVIDSRTLDNVSVRSDSTDDESSDADASVYDGNLQNNSTHSNSTLSSKREPVSKRSKFKIESQIRSFDALLSELKSQDRKLHKFRAIPRKWTNSQMCDVFLTKHNTPEDLDLNATYILNCECVNENDDRITKEYYVNLKIDTDKDDSTKNIYPSIELNDILMAKLKLSKFSRVTLSTKKTVLNFFERLELIPSSTSGQIDKQEIRDEFKRLLIKYNHTAPLLINQEQMFKLCGGDVVITAKIYPESFRYCLCDAEVLRENKIFISNDRKDVTQVFNVADEIITPDKPKTIDSTTTPMHIEEYENIIGNCVRNIVTKSSLDDTNRLRKSNNYLIIGSQSTGKSTICNVINKTLANPPYNCYVEIFQCAQNKSRKVESIQKDLRNILWKCVERAPSILLLENLDALAKSTNEHSQNGEYYNQVSDIIKHVIVTYTTNAPISVIATVTQISNLNQRLYTSRGNHIFDKIYKIYDLSKDNRNRIIGELCEKNQLKCEDINYDKFANLTEGYTIGHLMQFIDRAIFYAHRNDNNNPVLSNAVLLESLKTTNAYCLQGIKNNININEIKGDKSTVNQFAGLESVVKVFEEELIWPSKFPKIFGNSPLRNQAGILLYGAPGTGKTYLVSQISNCWNLRMISVKGPELLAKFIGQSEENIRNLFEKARNAKPCVLFFDEFDSIAPRRGHDSTGVTDRVVNQLLTELDGVEELKGVVVVAATSRPDLLDPALLRSGRIDRLVQCALPNNEARLNIFNSIAQSSSLKLAADVDFSVLCNSNTENFTGADIKSLLVSANMIAVKESIAYDANDIPDEIYITQKHVLEAFSSTTPSLSRADANKYKTLYSRFMNQEESVRELGRQRTTLA